jgi:GDP-4-dehydro-6-deoxy-D-mannose reductase
MVVKTEIPVKETNQLRPLSPYAVGKVSQDMLGFQYNHSYGMFIVRTRAFNHLGPRMKNSLVASNFSKQIAMIEKAKQEPVIYVGNLGVIRDFTDVRDIARAYWLSLKKCKPGEAYNICSGKGYKIKEVLEILLGFSKKKIKIMQERSRFRPSDAPVLIGDNTKFCGQAGWKPKISLERSLEDILNYWRSEV